MANFFIQRPVFRLGTRHHFDDCRWAGDPQTACSAVSDYRPTRGCPNRNLPWRRCATELQDTVTQVIEQNMNGIDNLMYIIIPAILR